MKRVDAEALAARVISTGAVPPGATVVIDDAFVSELVGDPDSRTLHITATVRLQRSPERVSVEIKSPD
jgi:hypothetical protein